MGEPLPDRHRHKDDAGIPRSQVNQIDAPSAGHDQDAAQLMK
jgi:hypothetical protein